MTAITESEVRALLARCALFQEPDYADIKALCESWLRLTKVTADTLICVSTIANDLHGREAAPIPSLRAVGDLLLACIDAHHHMLANKGTP